MGKTPKKSENQLPKAAKPKNEEKLPSVSLMRWLFDLYFSSSFLLARFWFPILKLVLNIFLVLFLNIYWVLIPSLRHIPLPFSISSYSQRLIILIWHRISPNLIKLLQSLGFVPCHSNHKLLASV